MGQDTVLPTDQPQETVLGRLGRVEAALLSLDTTVTWLRSLEEARSGSNGNATHQALAHPVHRTPSLLRSANRVVKSSNPRGSDEDEESDDEDAYMAETQTAYLQSLFNDHILSSRKSSRSQFKITTGVRRHETIQPSSPPSACPCATKERCAYCGSRRTRWLEYPHSRVTIYVYQE